MYNVDASQDWAVAYAEHQKRREDLVVRKGHKFRTFMESDVYKEVRDHVMKTFIHQTPQLKSDENGPITAFGVYKKQEGLRFFFDYIENVVKEAESIGSHPVE